MSIRSFVSFLLLAASFGACGEAPSPAALPPVTVYKSPSCGCCGKWVEHKRLVTEKPAAKGVAVPGMPLGSPGMEVPDGRTQPYDVELVSTDGSTSQFSRHGG
jgi:hypothetical protein